LQTKYVPLVSSMARPPRFESNLRRRARLPKGGKKDPRPVGGVGIKSQF
jgi:hypothetical protein